MHDLLRLFYIYFLSLFVLALDQSSKKLAQNLLNYAEPVQLFSWFDFTLHYNRGAAFSILSDAGGWQRWFLSAIAIMVSGILIVWLYTLRSSKGILPIGLSLILGGALGNVWDRIQLGYVVDFVSVHLNEWYFPTFNVADAGISIGVALILLDEFLLKK